MKVYFIRHGESRDNAMNIHQGASGPLSARGVMQAKATARRIRGINPEVILASDHERALQTAHIISGRARKRIVSTSLLGELKNPSEIVGRRRDAALSMKVNMARAAHGNDPSWHYSDEENPTDLIRRARRAVRYLSKRKDGSILVVSHSQFIHCMVGAMLFGPELDAALYMRIFHFLEMSNTGITECELSEKYGWRLVTWNDVAHLPAKLHMSKAENAAGHYVRARKRVYFVRHGESEMNASGRYQSASGSLSKPGMAQARAVARRLSNLKITEIMASDHERAGQTADAISRRIHKSPVITPLLNEWKAPSEIHGLAHDDPRAARIGSVRASHANDPDWHHSDEENIHDFIRRARRAVGMLERTRGTSVLSVTHSFLIRAMVLQMLMKGKLTPKGFADTMYALKTSNTGVTVCEMTKPGDWRLVTWNDTAHLS